MTYGWAILSAIIVIGALGSYFYFNQGGTGTAVVSAPLYAEAWALEDAGFSLGLKNNGGDDIDITQVVITSSDGVISCITAAAPGALASGASADIVDITTDNAGVDSCAVALVVGDNFKGTIAVSYTRGSSAIELTSTGSISGTVVA
jgi:hypothetical protein